jgi:signal transduction histidine kinase
LRLWLVAVGAAAVGLGVLGAPVLADAGRWQHPALVVALGLLVGWSFVGVGLFAWWRRPDNRVGALMTAVGFAWFAAGAGLVRNPLLHTFGQALSGLYYAVLVHMLLAFPSGRLSGHGRRRVVLVTYVVAVAGALTPMPFLDSAAVQHCDCAGNLLLVHRDDRLAAALLRLPEILGIPLLLAVAVLLARRWRAASPPQRRALAPVLGAGALAAGLSGAHFAVSTGAAPRPVASAVLWLALLAMVAVPGAFLLGLARTRFFQAGAVGPLVAALAEGPGAGRLRDALAAALGDGTVQVAYWLPERGGYADHTGRPIRLPAETGVSGRAVTRIERDGDPIAAIVYDTALAEEPALVRSVTAAAALALENERLKAALRARVADVENSRAQVVEATEAERRRLERDLHDGAQQRLVTLRLNLGLAHQQAARDGNTSTARLLRDAQAELDGALAELRELARGLHPALLSTRGLAVAARSLAARSPVPVKIRALELPPARLPGPIESAAYFVIAEGLTNVAKHAHATSAVIRMCHDHGRLSVEVGDDGVGGANPGGSGLRGLTARVAALDGTLRITSPGGIGTLVHAEIPLPAANGAAEGRVSC